MIPKHAIKEFNDGLTEDDMIDIIRIGTIMLFYERYYWTGKSWLKKSIASKNTNT